MRTYEMTLLRTYSVGNSQVLLVHPPTGSRQRRAEEGGGGIQEQQSFQGISPYANYLHRPTHPSPCGGLSWYAYMSYYEVVDKPRPRATQATPSAAAAAVPDDDDDDEDNAETSLADDIATGTHRRPATPQRGGRQPSREYYDLPTTHPSHKTKRVTRRSVTAVVRIHGPPLRPQERRDTEEKEDTYYRSLVLLFVPHTTMAAILPSEIEDGQQGTTWKAIYESSRAAGTLCPFAQTFTEHHESRWKAVFRSQDNAQAYRDRLVNLESQRDEAMRTGQGGDPEDFLADEGEESDVEATGNGLPDAEAELSDNDDNIFNESDDAEAAAVYDTSTPLDPLPGLPEAVGAVSVSAPLIVPAYTAIKSLAAGLRTIPEDDNDDAALSDGDDSDDGVVDPPTYPRRELTVQEVSTFTDLIRLAKEFSTPVDDSRNRTDDYNLLRAEWLQYLHIDDQQQSASLERRSTVLVTVAVDEPQRELPAYASVAEVSQLFHLTPDQLRAFLIAAEGFLNALLDDEVMDQEITRTENTEEVRRRSQRFLFLHGIGGSGKSFCIRALVALAISWGKPQAILTAAKSGVAAINVGGHTLDSLMYRPPKFFRQVRKIVVLITKYTLMRIYTQTSR